MLAESQKQSREQSLKTTGFNYPIYTHGEAKTANATRDPAGNEHLAATSWRGIVTIMGLHLPRYKMPGQQPLFTATRLPLTNLTSMTLPGIYEHPPPRRTSTRRNWAWRAGYSLHFSAASGIALKLTSSVLLVAYIFTKTFFFLSCS